MEGGCVARDNFRGVAPKMYTTTARLWAKLGPRAQELRRAATEAEEALWAQLRKSKLGARFRRQHAIGRFIADFVCLEARLIVEVDGEVHRAQTDLDQERDARLEQLGFRVLRFSNDAALGDMTHVLKRIRAALGAITSGTDLPLSRGEGPARERRG